MDIRMPEMDGLTATERLLNRPSPPRIIVLTTFGADDSVLRAMQAGRPASSSRTRRRGELVDAIKSAAAGRYALSDDVTRRLVEIAASRHLSLAAVRTPVSSILTKLGLSSRVQIAVLVHDASHGREEGAKTRWP